MKAIKITLAVFLIVIAAFCGTVFWQVNNVRMSVVPQELTETQQKELDAILDTTYPERNLKLKPLPYSVSGNNLEIFSGSAIVVDTETGNILFEKNADEVIPPASMTKLVEMFVVFDAVEKGEVSLDDEVPLPPESWAVNLPKDASIMFLGPDQHVSLRELLLGLAIASGNDASIAVAKYVCGDMNSFVERMNRVISDLGLKQTHFVESSGYSEKNLTTAKEFALFCCEYIRRFPFALEDFHAQKKLEYPLEHNLPDYQKSKRNSEAIIQYNTNKLLRELPGCDGLKTGFIYESRYNISVTAKRGNRRFLSITMKGPGIGSKEGNYYRVLDNTTMMEYAFGKFAAYKPQSSHIFRIPVSGFIVKGVNLIPACDEKFTVPFLSGKNPEDCAEKVYVTAQIPKALNGDIHAGQQYGTISYSVDGKTLRTIPLVADRTILSSSFNTFWGKLLCSLAKLK